MVAPSCLTKGSRQLRAERELVTSEVNSARNACKSITKGSLWYGLSGSVSEHGCA